MSTEGRWGEESEWENYKSPGDWLPRKFIKSFLAAAPLHGHALKNSADTRSETTKHLSATQYFGMLSCPRWGMRLNPGNLFRVLCGLQKWLFQTALDQQEPCVMQPGGCDGKFEDSGLDSSHGKHSGRQAHFAAGCLTFCAFSLNVCFYQVLSAILQQDHFI